MRCVGVIAVASLIAGVASADAADIPRPVARAPVRVVAAPAPPPFNGPYIGLLGGYGWGTVTPHAPVPPGNWYAPAIHPKGWLFGGTVGVNVQRDNLVFGAEGDFAWANIRGAGG